MQKGNGDTYFRLGKLLTNNQLSRVKEAIEAFTEKSMGDEESRKFAEEVITEPVGV